MSKGFFTAADFAASSEYIDGCSWVDAAKMANAKRDEALEEAERLLRIIVQGPSESEMWHVGSHIRNWLKKYGGEE